MYNKLFYSSAIYSGRFYIFFSALALLLGGSIYIFLRPSEHVFDRWIAAIGLDNWFDPARQGALTPALHLPQWIVFPLPNGFWAFAYALIITSIWSGSKSWFRYLWMASIPLLVLGFEALHYTGIIRGTFCIQDIAMDVAGLTLGIAIGLTINKPNNHEKVFE